jgi:hypothetical protein
MTAVEGDRPQAPPRPTNPSDGPPRKLSDLAATSQSALDDPGKLARAARMIQVSLARQGLTVADLRAPDAEHVRAA